jgi:hypothetical protein
MTRLARIVVPDCPHHVTQRGNRREPIFFEDGDQEVYRDLLAEQADRARVAAPVAKGISLNRSKLSPTLRRTLLLLVEICSRYGILNAFGSKPNIAVIPGRAERKRGEGKGTQVSPL